LGAGIFVDHREISAVKRVEFVSDRMTYIVLRGRWCKIIFLTCMHQVRRKVMIQKSFFFNKLQQVLDYFPKYNKKNLLRYFIAKLGRENIFTLKDGNNTLYLDINDSGVRTVNVATSKKI
jgi:hypothetical protein